MSKIFNDQNSEAYNKRLRNLDSLLVIRNPTLDIELSKNLYC